MSAREKLLAVQAELKAPKGQTNDFGKYKYRSCEDILESVKPLLVKNKASLVISDSLELIGERYYIKATATFMDVENGETIENTAFARESAEKRGMDDSQITGATSSYARKYALNGLFLIDDTKDADTNEFRNQQEKGKAKQESAPEYISKKEQAILTSMIQKRGLNVENVINGTPLDKVTPAMFADATKRLSKLPEVVK